MVPSHPVLLATTAAESAPGSVHVVWVASSVAKIAAPPGGVLLDKLDDLASNDAISPHIKYSIIKACNYLQGTEYARRFGNKGIVSVALNPGNLSSDLARHQSYMEQVVFQIHALATDRQRRLHAALCRVES